MAINKKKNVLVQITMPKEDFENLKQLDKSFNDHGMKSTKSDILVQAFREYLRRILIAGQNINKQKKAEEPQEEKKDA